MKVIGFVGSSRKGGNTDLLVRRVLEGAAGKGAQTEVVYLHDLNIKDCTGCMTCKGDGLCPIQDDMQSLYARIREADGIVLGSPIYMGFLTGQAKSFLDRWYAFLDANRQSRLPSGKKCALVLPQGQPDESLFAYVHGVLGRVFTLLGIPEVRPLVAGGVREMGDAAQKGELLAAAQKIGEELAQSSNIL
ncbi:MAG: flavodoxin family protein [Candidatus Tectomicrobia bacterium]|uniref:Flavodoxin family protein n=1 Tax=Tectimicrobiota bacterium TaxID=2528274 RepID=A0A932FW69_UNCTE|nr:flavodoxin family protein [Candidatus Tectomicrobia bacterium]